MWYKNCKKCFSLNREYIQFDFLGWVKCNDCGFEGPKAKFKGRSDTLWEEAWELWDEEHFIKEWEEKNGKKILK